MGPVFFDYVFFSAHIYFKDQKAEHI